MKKLLILILALIFVFSLVACNKDKCESHKDDNNDGICDVCEADVPKDDPQTPGGDNQTPGSDNQTPEHTVHTDTDANGLCDGCNAFFLDYDNPTIIGKILKSSLEKQFADIKSAKAVVDLEFLSESNGYYYSEDWDDTLEEYIQVEESYDSYREIRGKMEIWVDRSGESVNAKIVISTAVRYDPNEEFGSSDETATDTETVYIIDGYIYEELSDGVYTRERLVPEEVSTILGKLASVELLSTEKKNELLNALGAQIATVFNIKDNKGSVSFDAKPAIDELFAYIAALDLETDTVGGVLDDALALVSEDLTSAALVNELERVAGLTVNEALAEIDAWLTENHNTTLQGLYDTIVNNADVVAFLEAYIANNVGLDPTIPEEKAMIDEQIAEMQAVNFAELIAEAEIGSITLYELIISSLPTPSETEEAPAYPTKAEFFEMIRSYLGMTLAEFEEATGAPIFTAIKTYASYITVNKLNGKLDLGFEGMLSLKSINGELNVDMATTMPSEIEGKEDYARLALSVKLSVSEISSAANAIALPEEITVIDENLIDGYFYSDNNDYISTYYWTTEDGEIFVDLTAYLTDPNIGICIQISAYDIPFGTLLEDVIVIDDYTVYISGEYYDVPEGSLFKLTLDAENEVFTIVQFPAYNTTSELEMAVDGFAESESSTYGKYTLDSAIEYISVSSYGYRLQFTSDNYISNVYVTATYNSDTDMFDCVIVGFVVEYGHFVYKLDKSTSWYGGCYNLDEINVYFGGDPTFSIYLDTDTNTLKLTQVPDILDEYKKS